MKPTYIFPIVMIVMNNEGGELALDIFEDMEFPISECDKVVILKKEENEVDC